LNILEKVFPKTTNILQLTIPKIAVVDSTPLVNLYDMETAWDHTSKEKIKGFKLHATVNQSLSCHCKHWLRRAIALMGRSSKTRG
ncbi:MAG: hypothetical protein GX799_04530, partial [Crenarchaeota archaeon]|nr:hypothetical protein [Thermoproteota archaeon]